MGPWQRLNGSPGAMTGYPTRALARYSPHLLAWGLRNISSLITRRDEKQCFAPPGSWSSDQSRNIRVHMADSQCWVLLNTCKFVYELHNTHATLPLELKVPPMGLFSSARTVSQGCIVDSLDFHSRLAVF